MRCFAQDLFLLCGKIQNTGMLGTKRKEEERRRCSNEEAYGDRPGLGSRPIYRVTYNSPNYRTDSDFEA
jgi:hypothetical protein